MSYGSFSHPGQRHDPSKSMRLELVARCHGLTERRGALVRLLYTVRASHGVNHAYDERRCADLGVDLW